MAVRSIRSLVPRLDPLTTSSLAIRNGTFHSSRNSDRPEEAIKPTAIQHQAQQTKPKLTLSRSTTMEEQGDQKTGTVSHHQQLGLSNLQELTKIHRLSAEERRQAYDLLKQFSGRKHFTLPSDLPAWSAPSTLDQEISPDLILYRDYGSSTADWEEQNPAAKTTTFPASSTSSTPDTASSTTEPTSTKPCIPQQTSHSDRPVESKLVTDEDESLPEIDWTGWEPHTYNNHELEKLRAQYAERAKEFKRLSDLQRQQISQAKAAAYLKDPKATVNEGAEMMSDLAAVGTVDSLLLFTQSFLATELTRPTMTRIDQCSQWSSMIGFLDVAKSTTRRSGIALTHAICLMYESLLLDRLVEADRPLLLQMYSHETDTEKLLEGFKKLKRIMNYQEVSKASWLSAEKIFDKILSTSTTDESSPKEEAEPPQPQPEGASSKYNKDYREVRLPKLRKILDSMKLRERFNSPKLCSVDKPYRFCWPLDKTNLDSMADFVAFSRCALNEFLTVNKDKIKFKLAVFNDSQIIFPSTTTT
ncbi:hypothetical protein PSTT_01986 [Puccinia striiformis]|uniref:Uncharacterized protein n=1 Tax=Puccinia striiformis TaxID=27350 RepID=A0A2S4W1N3_9BASI|nr:hypothetical protein PSTT_01986 [Puccinia striiformis]